VTLVCPAGTATEFAVGEGSPELDAYLRPDDVAHAIRIVLAPTDTAMPAPWRRLQPAEHDPA
jgi:hypothetical protein